MAGVGLDAVREAAEQLTGDILQVPPMVSAVKVDGQAASTSWPARASRWTARPARSPSTRFTVGEPSAPGRFPIEVTCSSGTYIRSLAADIGTAARRRRPPRRPAPHRHRLVHRRRRRRRSRPSTPEHLLTPAEAMRDLRAVTVEGDARHRGRRTARRCRSRRWAPSGLGPGRAVDATGDLLAVYEPHRSGTAKPSVVLAPGDADLTSAGWRSCTTSSRGAAARRRAASSRSARTTACTSVTRRSSPRCAAGPPTPAARRPSSPSTATRRRSCGPSHARRGCSPTSTRSSSCWPRPGSTAASSSPSTRRARKEPAEDFVREVLVDASGPGW